MQQYRPTEIMVVCGQKGSGKSHLAEVVCKNIDRILIYDTLHEHGAIAKPTYTPPKEENLNGKVVFQPLNRSRELFDQVCGEVWKRGNICFMVDECDRFASKFEPLTPNFDNLVNLGRHRRCGLICVTRRLARLHNDIISQADSVVSFYQYLNRDVDTLAENLGDQAEIARNLSKDRHNYLHFKEGTIKVFSAID